MSEIANEPRKLPFGIKIGYGFAALSDGTAYVFFYSFFMLFMTDYAGVDPMLAGSVSLIVVLWDAVTDPIVGWLSDNCKWKWGRRRPFFLIGIVPWMITLVLMFSVIDAEPQAKFIYYVIMAMLFWTSYTICDVPFKAFGAELTSDYSERATLRLFGQFFSSSGVAIAVIFTMLLVGFFSESFQTNQAWAYVAGVYAIISFFGYIVMWRTTRGWDKPMAERSAEEQQKENVFKTYYDLIKEVKPLRYLLAAILAFMCGNSLYGSGIFYAFTYLLQWDAAQIAGANTYITVLGFILVFVVGALVKKFDKKQILIVFLTISTVSLFAFKFIGMTAAWQCYAYVTFYAFSNLGFWALIWAIVYDVAEVDELLHGKRREGSTTAVGSFVQKLGSALALWLVGFSLSIGGYDPAAPVQTESALEGILNTITVYPGVFTLISLILVWRYPINGKNFQLVRKALEDKKATGEYSREGLERIL
ncbi:MAG: glycoside-pentoside-hexuronide (GPH):cation symporter [Bacillota bacterium]|nr:glycoside-pentoside-hexuronide (GPH):cation symporter [Bacillota bacterium]